MEKIDFVDATGYPRPALTSVEWDEIQEAEYELELYLSDGRKPH